MDIKVKKINSVEFEVTVALSEKEIQPARERAYSMWQKRVAIPGYRKGKSPLELVVKMHKNEIERELKDSLSVLFYKKALQELKIVPVTQPLLLESNLSNNGGCVFKMKVEEKPKIKISKYKNIRAQKASCLVKDEEVDEVLENLKKERAQWVDISRPSRDGDFIVLDMNIETQSGKKEKRDNVSYLLKSSSILPALYENLIGIEANIEKNFDIDVPHDFEDKKIAGEKCKFSIKAKSIKEKKEPTIDDAFAKELGKYETLQDIKNAIKDELKSHKDGKVEAEVEEMIFSELIEKTKFEIPPQLLAMHTKKVAENITMRMLYKGMSREDIEKQVDSIMKDAQKEAEKQLRIFFILEDIAQKENIIVEEKEYDEYVNKLAGQYKVTKEELEKLLQEKNETQNINQQLKREKVIKFLKENADIINK